MKRLCVIAGLPRSTFYFGLQPKRREENDQVLRQRLQESQERLDFTYGAKRMAKHLQEEYGEVYNHKRVADRMVRWGLNAKIRRRRYPDRYYRERKAEQASLPANHLKRDFSADRPKQKLVTDVTYFRVVGGWLYMSAIQDLHNKEILAHSVSGRLDMDLVLKSLGALPDDGSMRGCLFHSDRCWTYTHRAFITKLAILDLTQSLSRKGNPWDNAVIENFFGLLKSEIHYNPRSPLSANELQTILERYIGFYNKGRIQKKLGYRTPVQYRESIA